MLLNLASDSWVDRKSTRLNSSHGYISYAVFCLKKKRHGLVHDGKVHTVGRERSARTDTTRMPCLVRRRVSSFLGPRPHLTALAYFFFLKARRTPNPLLLPPPPPFSI